MDLIGDLGTLLQTQEKLQEAEPLCREALEKSRKVRGEDHRRTLTALSELAILLQSQGKLNEAEPLCREALLKQRRLFGDEQLETMISYNSLAGLLIAQNKHAEAASLLIPVELAARKTLTNAHATRLAQFLMLLGKARAGIAQFTSAEVNLLEAHPLFVKTLSINRKSARACSEALVDLYSKWNMAEPGKSYDAKAAEWRGKITPMPAEPGKPDAKGTSDDGDAVLEPLGELGEGGLELKRQIL